MTKVINTTNETTLDLLAVSEDYAIDWRHHVFRIKTGTLIPGTLYHTQLRWGLTIDNVERKYNWETLQAMAKLLQRLI